MNSTHHPINLHYHTHDYHGLTQELLIALPNTDKPCPGVIILHPRLLNCYSSLQEGHFLSQHGFATCMPSMLGYGNSQGQPDYAGDHTLAALQQALHLFTSLPQINPHQIAIWGISLGAMVTARLITQNTFSAAILQSGAYDFLAHLQYNQSNQKFLQRIQTELPSTSDQTPQQILFDRSPINHASDIHTPILLLHGEFDQIIPPTQAHLLDQKLTQHHKPHQLHIISKGTHFIGSKVRQPYVLPFLQQHLKTL